MKPNHDEIEAGATQDLSLRASVATYNRVLFPHPKNGTLMLALERKATVWNGGDAHDVRVQAQPFGGAVRILNSIPLQGIIGPIQFDSARSQQDGDFRILIPPSKWELVKEYCLHRLENTDSGELESAPHRELAEEFDETLHVSLRSDQYTALPLGFVIEDNPAPTENANALGLLTVRLYRIFEVYVIDRALCKTMLTASQGYSDQDLGMLARKDFEHGGRGWANSILTLPLERVTKAYLAIAPDLRFKKIIVENHELDESVLAILEDVDVAQYQRL